MKVFILQHAVSERQEGNIVKQDTYLSTLKVFQFLTMFSLRYMMTRFQRCNSATPRAFVLKTQVDNSGEGRRPVRGACWENPWERGTLADNPEVMKTFPMRGGFWGGYPREREKGTLADNPGLRSPQ